MKFVKNISSFKSGTLSRKIDGRGDTKEYDYALSESKNFLISKQGGLVKDLGVQYISKLGVETIQLETVILFGTHTLELIFSSNGALTLLDSDGHRVYSDLTLIALPIGGIAFGYSVAVYNTFIIITHSSGKVQPTYIEILNNSSGNLEVKSIRAISTFSYKEIPLGDRNTDTSKKLKVLGLLTNNLFIESIGFNLQDEFVVGDQIMITGLASINRGNAQSERLVSGMYRVTAIINPFRVSVVQAFNFGGIDPLANILYNLAGGIWSTSADTDISNEMSEWSRTIWGTNRGWPTKVSINEGRVLFAGSPDQPSAIVGSAIGNPTFFLQRRFDTTSASIDLGYLFTARYTYEYGGDLLESDPFLFVLDSKYGSGITFIESSRSLIVGTTSQEIVITGNGQAISNRNISANPHTSHGSAVNLSVAFDNIILFASRNRELLYLFQYSRENGSFVSQELTILNPDIFDGKKIKQLSWHEELGVCYILFEDGTLSVLCYNKQAGVIGFMELDHTFSIDSLGYGLDNLSTYTYFVASRNGKKFLGRFSKINVGVLPLGLSRITEKFNYLDGNKIKYLNDSSSIVNRGVRYFDGTDDYVFFPDPDIQIGDTIQFTDISPVVLPSLGLLAGIDYYLIPVTFALNNFGFRLATSLANANNNIFVSILPVIAITASPIPYSITKNRSTIYTGHFAANDVVKVYKPTIDSHTVEDLIVDGSDFTDLGTVYSAVAYGLPFESTAATMPIEAGQEVGSSQLGMKRVQRVSVRLIGSQSIKIGTDGYNYELVEEAVPYTGRKIIDLTGSSEYDLRIHIKHDRQEPFYLSSMVLKGVSNDG